MIRTLDLRGRDLHSRELRGAVPRAALDVEAALAVVRPICDDVAERGVPALLELTARFDGVQRDGIAVPPGHITAALAGLDADIRAALEESIRRVRLVHAAQLPAGHTTTVVPGGTVLARWVPVERVGLYVPGGLAVYPSSVVMNVVAAQEAGVTSIAVASPPQRDHGGDPHPAILAACALLGVSEVYAVGGAQAVAMFAYGAPDEGEVAGCAAVDIVTGPGNIYVAAAKRLVKGRVGIDSEAGPTEIAILADDAAEPRFIAADMISQAEHDPMAAAVLITPSSALADAVRAELDRQLPAAKHAERIATALAGPQSAVILVDDLDAGMAVVDAYAAEHLEIHTVDAAARARRVRNAGAIFVGPWTPVSLGDYAAGSNHVLPTSGCACHSSGLSVMTFLRAVHVVTYDEAALAEVARHVEVLAAAEDLPAHGAAVAVRRRPTRAGRRVSPVDLPLRADLRDLMPYGAPQLDVPVRLNTNENTHDVPPEVAAEVVAALAGVATTLNRYPDRDARVLRQELAGYMSRSTGAAVGSDQVWAANGSNEVLQQLLLAFGGPGRRALGFVPSYAMHQIIARVTGTQWLAGRRRGADFDLEPGDAAAQVAEHEPDLVFLCSPNNPTGTSLDPAVVTAVQAAAPGAIVVVDEAYAEFARPGSPSAVHLLPGSPLLVVTRTMSKAFAFAGARVGYLVAGPAVVEAMYLVRLPYHLSSLTQAAALAALRHTDRLLATVAQIVTQRDRISVVTVDLGYSPVASDANFVLIGGFGDAPAAWRDLLKAGVLVRDVGLPGHLRVTAGTATETQAFLDALASLPRPAAHPTRTEVTA